MGFKVLKYIFLRFAIFIALNFIFGEAYVPKNWIESSFYIAFLLLFFPVIEALILTLPFRYGIKQEKKGVSIWLLFLSLFILEFLMYVFMTSGTVDKWNFAKTGTSIITFLFFFRKELFSNQQISIAQNEG
jgi:hypothetical protein